MYEGDKKLNKNDERNLLSCKDLCSLDILPDLIEAGIDSLKIEGRMKAPRYTAGVVSIWRKYLDLYNEKGRAGYKVEKTDRKLLLDLFDRGGQTDGYYKEHNGKDMIALHEKPVNKQVNSEYFDYLDKTFVEGKKQLSVSGSIRLKENLPITFDVSINNLKEVYGRDKEFDKFLSVEIIGDIPQPAKNKAVSLEDVDKQLKKTGNSRFYFENLRIALDDNLFIPLKALNEIRREALDKLEEKILTRYTRDDSDIHDYEGFIHTVISGEKKESERVKFNILCENMEQIDGAIQFAKEEGIVLDEISIESELLGYEGITEKINTLRSYSSACNLYMPHIFRDEAKKFFNKYLNNIRDFKFDNFIVRSLEEIFYINDNIDASASIILDYNIYAYNKNTIDFYNEKFNVKRLTYPLELNLNEMKQLENAGNEMVAYGKIPMMVSAQCLKKTTKGCDHKKEVLVLKDRKNSEMQVKTHCDFCYNTILNSKPLSVIGMEKEIKKIAPGTLRLWFTTENVRETKAVIRKYFDYFIKGIDVENISDFTRGHLKRGIE